MFAEFEPTAADVKAFARWMWKSGQYVRRSRNRSIAGMLIWFALLAVLQRSWLVFGAGLVLACGLLVWLRVSCGRQVLRAERSRRSGAGAKLIIELTAEGVIERTLVGHTLTRWFAVENVECRSDYLFIQTAPLSGCGVPRRALASDEEWRGYTEYASASFARSLGTVPHA